MANLTCVQGNGRQDLHSQIMIPKVPSVPSVSSVHFDLHIGRSECVLLPSHV